MKRIITALAITSTLLTIQACTSQVKSSDTSDTSNSYATAIADTNPHTGHNNGDAKTPGTEAKSDDGHNMENEHHEHSGHSQLESANAIANLSLPSKIIPQTPVILAIDIKDNAGKAITNFDKFQEQIMHLIVVSDDLQSFQHIHPTYKGKGSFQVKNSFPISGGYTLFSDYKVAGKSEQVSVSKAQVTGKSPAIPKTDLDTNKIFINTKVSLKLSQLIVKAGEEIHVILKLEDTISKKPPTDLKSYLGERGHLVIIKQSSPLTRADYIHAHAIKNTPSDEIHFITSFPKSGKYKMWGQFNRGGKIVTSDFWVDVQ